jgi:Holliday junction resolvase RusA-like endonuclease
VTYQEKRATVRNGKLIFYEDKKLAAARIQFEVCLALRRPKQPLTGAVRLTTKWYYPGKVDAAAYKTTKPDTDNMIKLLKDCMTKIGFWKDDAQVASETTEKFLVPDHFGIYICAKEISDELL